MGHDAAQVGLEPLDAGAATRPHGVGDPLERGVGDPLRHPADRGPAGTEAERDETVAHRAHVPASGVLGARSWLSHVHDPLADGDPGEREQDPEGDRKDVRDAEAVQQRRDAGEEQPLGPLGDPDVALHTDALGARLRVGHDRTADEAADGGARRSTCRRRSRSRARRAPKASPSATRSSVESRNAPHGPERPDMRAIVPSSRSLNTNSEDHERAQGPLLARVEPQRRGRGADRADEGHGVRRHVQPEQPASHGIDGTGDGSAHGRVVQHDSDET